MLVVLFKQIAMDGLQVFKREVFKDCERVLVTSKNVLVHDLVFQALVKQWKKKIIPG